jgi:hypothetical protein
MFDWYWFDGGSPHTSSKNFPANFFSTAKGVVDENIFASVDRRSLR